MTREQKTEEPQKADACDCEETSCREGCSKNHTHKTFWCEKCRNEDRSHLIDYPKKADERPWEQEFDATFELEFQGCSECGGCELIDKREIRFPEGKYHCEYDLEKIKDFIQKTVSK